MWDSATKALQWIIDTLLKHHADQAVRKEKRWTQVADHLDKVASLLDSAIEDYKKGLLPERQYARLSEIRSGFEEVLARVFDMNDEKQVAKSFKLRSAFDVAIHVMDGADAEVLGAPSNPEGEQGKQFIADLEAAVGQFHGAADNLRATAT